MEAVEAAMAALVDQEPEPVEAVVDQPPAALVGEEEPVFEIRSLLEGHKLYVSLAAAPGALVRVRSLRVRHAAAMEALLTRSVRAPRRWRVLNLHRIIKLAVADRLFTVGVDAHLGLIRRRPRDVPLLTAFRNWTWELQHAARDVGGEFYGVVCVLCRLARKVGAAGFTRRRTNRWIRMKLKTLRVKILAAREGTVLLPQ